MAGQREKVIAGINSLTKLLRKTLGDSRETIPLEQELNLLQDYFSIQQLRYGDGIRLCLNIREECLSVEVPRFFPAAPCGELHIPRLFNQPAQRLYQYLCHNKRHPYETGDHG